MGYRLGSMVTSAVLRYILLVLAIILYGILTYFAPDTAQNQDFNLTPLQLNILKVTIILPYLGVWVLAVYGLTTLGAYLAQNKDQNSDFTNILKAIHSGLGWIIASLITTTVVGSLQNIVPQWEAQLTIVTNYLYILPLLVGFWLMYRGVQRVVRKIHTASTQRGDHFINTLMVMILAVLYSVLVLTNPTRQFSTDALHPASFYLPDVLIVTTIIIPAVVAWWLGISLTFSLGDIISRFTSSSRYVIMSRIMYSIWAIIFTSILVQVVLSLGSTRVSSIGLAVVLLVLYVFVFLQGVGYLFFALAVRQLKKTKNILP